MGSPASFVPSIHLVQRFAGAVSCEPPIGILFLAVLIPTTLGARVDVVVDAFLAEEFTAADTWRGR
jgi:hypothetical protein